MYKVKIWKKIYKKRKNILKRSKKLKKKIIILIIIIYKMVNKFNNTVKRLIFENYIISINNINNFKS